MDRKLRAQLKRMIERHDAFLTRVARMLAAAERREPLPVDAEFHNHELSSLDSNASDLAVSLTGSMPRRTDWAPPVSFAYEGYGHRNDHPLWWLKRFQQSLLVSKRFFESFVRRRNSVDVQVEKTRRPAQKKRRALVLTALGIETKAVLRHLLEVEEEIVRGTVFYTGNFNEWTVSVAECGEGNVPAAAIVDRGIGHFHPEVALFVGVAGGVKDVSIGDALISSKVYSYERGKDTDGGFRQRPNVNLAAHSLDQRARSISHRERWKTRLSADLRHQNPRIHIGAIAAGEKVVASSASATAKFLRESYGDTLGVEMEGGGFLSGVHINAPVEGCVIRGISDLLDGKPEADKAGSQERAADVASAVAFEMLATLHLA